MKLLILHISDLHFKDNADNSAISKSKNLVDAIKNKTFSIAHVFIVVTGDMAYSGKEEEFDLVYNYLQDIKEKLNNVNNRLKIEFIFSPGNHDCDFSDLNQEEVREILRSSVLSKQDDVKQSVAEQITFVQNNYFEFIKKFDSYQYINQDLSNNLFTKYEYEIDGFKISFNAFNTAWMSSKNEKQSEMIYPLNLIGKVKIERCEANLKIAMFHHPFHWMQHQNIRVFKEFVKNNNDIVFTGHEHTVSANTTEDILNSSNIIYIEAGTIQDSHNELESSFNLIEYDTSNNEPILLNSYKWENDDYKHHVEKDISTNIDGQKKIFELKTEQKEKISRLQIKINHPEKDNVQLYDLFVYPNVKRLNIAGDLTRKQFLEISSKDIVSKDTIGHNIVYGEDNSGKTTLSHVFQDNLIKDKEIVTIIICSREFKSNINIKTIEKIIRQSFKRQYITNDKVFSEFDKLDRSKVLLVVEDFHRCSGNNEYKSLIINTLLKMKYQNIIITANDSLQMEATSETELSKTLSEFNHFEILEFGHKLRDKLIKKWIGLGREYDIEKMELSNRVRSVRKHISKTVGFNIVKAYPLYLITLLQAMEIQNTSLDKSALGHYYDFLILQSIKSTDGLKNIEQKDINTVYTYCSELAFQMFIDRQHEFTLSELEEFDVDYKRKKDFFPNYSLKDRAIKTTLLVNHDDKYKFSQKYIYYFFVAHYFSKHIDKGEITDIIKAMTQRLYRTEFSNILMFILHLTPKTDIINMIQDEANKLFSEIEEFSFSKDELQKINSCVKKDVDSSLRLENRSVDESRSREVEEDEVSSNIEKHIYYDDRDEADYNEEIKQLDFYKKINLAFKIIEILGEITKSYSGTLDGEPKAQLVQSVYSLGLRSLKTFISLFEEEHEQLVEHIRQIIVKKNKVTADKIDESVQGIIFGLASSIALSIVKKISKSVGTQDLNHLYKRMHANNKDNIAYHILKIAIDLDFQGGLNEQEIIGLFKELKIQKNVLPNSTLRNLALEHLYMFETSISRKTSLCTKLEIDANDAKKQLSKQIKL
ncbi:MAG: metallophosphoesterase [Sulfurimonas sp.]|uniref:metallophosphoesterase n=1 Tax=Sulfurimonas sp. TaxID=2022749 RepID=UPI0026070C23|nr:metallophosphoesterase [Sulfurimonas sp.]MDD5401096.1 metallophosphoesterase [Sulfurimonas sp.]